MSPIFPIQFFATCSSVVWVSWKCGKIEKDKPLNYNRKQEKVTNKIV